MAKKRVVAVVKLQIRAGQATPAPPVGTALGQHGVNIMEFCRQYNEQTQQFAGQVIPVELTIYEHRSFTFITKQSHAGGVGVSCRDLIWHLTAVATLFIPVHRTLYQDRSQARLAYRAPSG